MKYIKLFEDYKERYDKIEKALHKSNFRNNRNAKPLNIIGGGNGSGKIYSIETILKEMDEEYIIIVSSNTTPTSFYNALYEHRDIIVIIDGLYGKSSTNNEMRVNKIITQLCKGKMITHPYPHAPNPPETIMQFKFTGRVILSTPDLTHTPRGIDEYVNTIFLGFS